MESINKGKRSGAQIGEVQIVDAIRKTSQLPEDKKIWLDGFMEGIVRGGARETPKA